MNEEEFTDEEAALSKMMTLRQGLDIARICDQQATHAHTYRMDAMSWSFKAREANRWAWFFAALAGTVLAASVILHMSINASAETAIKEAAARLAEEKVCR